MKNKINRTRKIRKFEDQILQSIMQRLRGLMHQQTLIENQIQQWLQAREAMHASQSSTNLDHVGHRRSIIQQSEHIDSSIEILSQQKQQLDEVIQQVREELVNQKIQVEIMDKLLKRQLESYQKLIAEQQQLELLDIANTKFVEASQ